MASGVRAPGGIKNVPAGGLHAMRAGGIDNNGTQWRNLQGFANVDAFGPLVASGARVAQTRGVRNPRKDAKTTGFTYAWTLPTVGAGSTTAVSSITGGSTATATFTPDVAGTYVFRCTITFTGSGKTQVVNFTYTSA